MKGYYIRHKGYDKNIKQTWAKLQTWIYTNDIKIISKWRFIMIIQLLHQFEECQYIAIAVLEMKIL